MTSKTTWKVQIQQGPRRLWGSERGWGMMTAEIETESRRDELVAEAVEAGLPHDVVEHVVTYQDGTRTSDIDTRIGGTAELIKLISFQR